MCLSTVCFWDKLDIYISEKLMCYIRSKILKIFLCWVGVIHLFFNKLSNIATICSIIITELFPAGFSCINNFILSHNSIWFSEKKMVYNPYASKALLCNSFLGGFYL